MLPPAGSSPAEQWVAEGRLAAACDMFHRLQSNAAVDRVYILAAERADGERLAALGGVNLPPIEQPFHYGHALASVIRDHNLERIAYFGGASAPLLTESQLTEILDRVSLAKKPLAVVNNYHSSDWAVLNHAHHLPKIAEDIPSDNALGWVLDHQAQFQVESLVPSAATRSDIDTPADLILIQDHPNIGPALQAFLNEMDDEHKQRIHRLRVTLRTPARTILILGRMSSHLWGLLEQKTQVWTRIFAEERGMVASGRVERGEVQSLIGDILGEWGIKRFVSRLADISDAVLWDTRVWMAHLGKWPAAADRFAADLGWTDQIQTQWLRDFTMAIFEASIPIIVGGHGAVSGGLYAILETL
jgi:hypothetical protein